MIPWELKKKYALAKIVEGMVQSIDFNLANIAIFVVSRKINSIGFDVVHTLSWRDEKEECKHEHESLGWQLYGNISKEEQGTNFRTLNKKVKAAPRPSSILYPGLKQLQTTT